MDKLEDLPPKLVVVFTTNDLASLPRRFVGRCIGGKMVFRSDAHALEADARALAGRIWARETGQPCPADVLDAVVREAVVGGELSFREVVQALVPLIGAEGAVS